MTNLPLRNASLIGILLAVLAIGLFILLYVGLGAANVANPGRLFASLCVPPLIIALVVGAYAMRARGS